MAVDPGFLGESFDHYTGLNSGQLPIVSKYDLTGPFIISAAPSIITGRFGVGQAMRMNVHISETSTTARRFFPFGATSDFAFEFSFRRSGLEGLGGSRLINMEYQGTVQFYLAFTAAGAISVYRGDGTLLGTTARIGIVLGAAWTTIGIEGTVGNAGWIRLKVDGRERLYLATADLQNHASIDDIDSYRLYAMQVAGQTINIDFDDIYIRNVDQLFDQPVKAESLYPNSDAGPNDWTRNTGSSDWSAIDEPTPDGDTSYLESNTVGHQTRHGLTDLSTTPAQIFAVQVCTVARKTDAGLREITASLVSGGTTDTGQTNTLGLSYQMETDAWLEDPDTSAAWNSSGVNNLEIEMELVT